MLQSLLINAVNSFQNLLTNVGLASLQMGGSGLDIDNNGEPLNSLSNLLTSN